MTKLATKVILALGILAYVCSAAPAEPPFETFYLDNLATAPNENGPGHGFQYQSICQSPGEDDAGNVYYDWWYFYYLENNSTEHDIVSWTWSYDGFTGPIMPGVHVGTNVDPNSDPMPLHFATGVDRKNAFSRAEDFSDLSEYAQVTSTITWSDGYTEEVQVYIPKSAPTTMIEPVAEPGGLLAISTGLIGLVGIIRRRRA